MFKKGLFLLMPSLIIPFFTSSSISKGQIKLSPKIVFENDSYESLSLENDENTEEPQNLSVLIKLDYDEFKETTIESDNVNLIREKLFKEGKSYHSAKNKELAKKLDLSNFDNVYVSEYSPYISVDTTFSNYDVHIIDTNGNIVASQTTSSDCIEFLTIKAPKDGFYGIKVVQKGNKVVEGEKIAISYTLYNE